MKIPQSLNRRIVLPFQVSKFTPYFFGATSGFVGGTILASGPHETLAAVFPALYLVTFGLPIITVLGIISGLSSRKSSTALRDGILGSITLALVASVFAGAFLGIGLLILLGGVYLLPYGIIVLISQKLSKHKKK